jgi:hypothetical protein
MSDWMPGAEIHDIGDHAPTDGGPAKAIAHITWDKNATASSPADWVSFDNLVNYFTGSGQGSAPHLIWDPFSGRVAQLFPASSRSKSVVDSPGGTRTNRAGSVVIQIEAVFFPYCRKDGVVYARLEDTPCKGWDAINAWCRDLGIPDVWPMGKPRNFDSNRSEATWESQGGWYGHSQVPENDHQDPGSWPDFVNGGTTTPPTNPEPTPARYKVTIDGLEYGYGAVGDQVTRVGQALVAKGFGGYYSVGPGPTWSDADTRAYQAYQQSLGLTGSAADGIPGPESLHKLLGPQFEPFPGAGFFTSGRRSPIIAAMHARLVAVGCGRYQSNTNVDVWGSGDVNSYKAWQKSLGYYGSSADGIPGKTSWDKLMVPKS